MTAVTAPAPQRLFSPVVVLAMVLVGVFSFSAFMALSAYAPDLRSGQDGRGHALSRSAIGFAGMVQLLRNEGRTVLISRGPLASQWTAPPASGRTNESVLVLTPDPGDEAKELAKLKFNGWTLIVLPKWDVAAQDLHRGWVDKAGLLDGRPVMSAIQGLSKSAVLKRRRGVASPVLEAATGSGLDAGLTMPLGNIDSLQSLSGPGLNPMLVDEQGRAVLVRVGRSSTLILADPDLMNTQGLAELANARAADDIIGLFGKGPVIFDATLNGFERGRSLLRLAFEPPLLGVVLCLLAAAALMGLHAAGRFGPPQRSHRSLALGKLALADNSAGLIRMARREPRMAAGYAALIRDGAARAVGVPRDLGAGQAEAVLDRLGAAKGARTPFSELAAGAETVKTNRDLMRLARQLFEWRREMTRERR